MKDIWSFGLTVAGGLTGIAAFAYYACHLAENGLSAASREKLTRSLETLRLTPTVRAAFQSFTFAADAIFGRKLFSVRALTISAVWTVCWIAVVFAFATFSGTYRPPFMYLLAILLTNMLILVGAALLIDFLCLTKSRLLIRWSLPRGVHLVTLCAVLDLLLSAALFYYLFTLAFFIAALYNGKEGYSFGTYLKNDVLVLWKSPFVGIYHAAKWPTIYSNITTPREFTFSFGPAPFFWASMLTSFWMFLYLIGYLAMATAVRFDFVKSAVLPTLNLSQKPFSAIGFLIVMISLVVGIASTTVFALTRMLSGV